MAQHTTTPPGGALSKLGSFLVTFVALFAVMFVFLAAVDALPEASSSPAHTASGVASGQTASNPSQPELPTRVAAAAIGLDVSVKNPVSTDVDVLDETLLSGAVRYPTSAQLGVDGTVLIFGHSSYLPIVHNQNYKAFDGIQNLKAGEVVSVYSGTREYRYRVVSVRVADATEDVVELPLTGKHLVLVTCDSFSKKTNRFVVTADFVGTYSLAN
jgi:LPXTG-site transpeptidase (sortase) family protein